jgi:uncharacterized protein
MPLYFLDTSALLPAYWRGAKGFAWVSNLIDPSHSNTLFLAEITEAELSAALYSLVRSRHLNKKRCDAMLKLFWEKIDAGGYSIIPAVTPIVRQAAALCEHHSLKGYDAVQLACALAARNATQQADAENIARGLPPAGDPIFLTEDNRLASAALAEGFVVDSPINHL